MGEEDKQAHSKDEIKTHPIWGLPNLEDQVQAPMVKAMRVLSVFIDRPTRWFKESIVDKYRGEPYPYYHRKFPRVPEVHECYTDDQLCIYEADQQYNRDRSVDFEIVKILRQRYFRCSFYERAVNDYEYDLDKICTKEKAELTQARINLFIKYGELGPYQNVLDAFMKQKHRLIMERRLKAKEANQSSS